MPKKQQPKGRHSPKKQSKNIEPTRDRPAAKARGAPQESTRSSHPTSIVGVGASAGGLEAFERLLAALPEKSGMGFVLVQHLAPRHESILSELLSKTTQMPVVEVKEGVFVARDHVYVIPPNKDMSIANGVLHLTPMIGNGARRMPIDAFLRSLAEDQQSQAIGVILSGTASDGTLGLQAIKASGGVTFAQDEESAKYNAMPRNAIAAGIVDFVLPPEQIARELARIANHAYMLAIEDEIAESPQTDSALNKIFLLLRNVSRVDFSYYKPATIKKIETQLHEALENWSSLVENAPDVIMTLKSNGRIEFVNRSVWGVSATALVGTNILDYLTSADRNEIEKCIKKTVRTRRRTSHDVIGVNGDSDSWYSLMFGLGRSASGRLIITAIIREITEQKRLEESLRSSGEQLRQFAARLEVAQEEERTRLAREIHDELGQALTVLKLDLSWLHQKTRATRPVEKNKLKSMMDYVDGMIERVRDIASALRPSILDDLGLVAAIEWQLSQCQVRGGLRCQFESNVDKLDVSRDCAGAVFRVLQEALTNVMRHSKASNVRVRLKSNSKLLSLTIADNGTGAKPEQLTNLRSLGIMGMKERIENIGGTWAIQSRSGKGTRIELTVPIQS